MEMEINYEPMYEVELHVRSAIEARRKTKAEVAKLAGLPYSTVMKLCETNRKVFDIRDLSKIAKALKITKVTSLVELYTFDPANTIKNIIEGDFIRLPEVEGFVFECQRGTSYGIWTEKEAIVYAAEGLLELMRKRKVKRSNIDGIADRFLHIKNLSSFLDKGEEEKYREYEAVAKAKRENCFWCKYYDDDKDVCTNKESENYQADSVGYTTCDKWEEWEEEDEDDEEEV